MQQMQPESNPPPPPLDHYNILSALTVLSGGNGSAAGTHIKEAETALLAWESCHPDDYSTALLSVIYSNPTGPNGSNGAIPRLAAVLALKACVGRKWKDRGRGARPLPRRRNGGAGPAGTSASMASSAAGTRSTAMMSDQTKDAVRYSILSIIVGATVSPGTEQQLIGMPHLSPALAAVLTNDSKVQSSCTSLVAKIGRLDLPMKFHNLIPTLVACATSADASVDQQRRYNALRALDAVLTDLCDKRLLLDKKYVASVVSSDLSTLVKGGLVPAMDGIGNALSSSGQGCDDGRAKLASQYGTLMISVLRRLLRHSLPAALNSASASAEAADKVYEVSLQSIPVCLGVVCQRNGAHDENDGVSGLLDELCRLIVDVQKASPIEFGRYLGPFLALFEFHFVELSGTIAAIKEDSAVGRFVMAAMIFMSNVLGCSKYEPDEKTNAAIDSIREGSTINLDGTKRTITSTGDTFSTPSTLSAIEHAVRVVWGYFTTSKMEQLADLTIRRHMPLSQCRLDEWADDPEAYFQAEASRASDDDINSCAQALYLSLVESRMAKNVVAPQIVTMLRDLDGQAAAARAEADGTASMDTVLLLDAIYTAAGVSLGVLENSAGFAFSAFFDEYLLPCLEMLIREQKEGTPNLPILRHRIVWLIASNTFSVPVASRSRLYQTILSIIVADQSRQNDIVVKLTAAQVLNNSLFERDESLLIFKEHSDAIISALYRLASICEEYDSRSLVLSCVSFVLTYLMGCGTMSEGTASVAVQPLGKIWEESVDQNALLKRDVLSILSCIAQAVGPELSTHLHPIALPMLDVALDPAQRDDNLFLVEDALGLWLSLVRLSPEYSESLGMLFPRVQGLLEEDLEHVKVLMMTTECYILLGGPTFLNLYPSALQSVLVHTVGQVRPRGAAYAFLVLEALMKAYPVEGGQLLLQAGVLGTMLQSCTALFNEDDHSEPDRVISLYLTTLSRALIASPGIMDNVFAASSDGAAFGPSELIQLYLGLFGYEISSSFDGLRRKLWALMLLFLLPPTVSLYGEAIVNHLDKLLHICAVVLGHEGDSGLLAPYDVGYDDDEEAFIAGEASYGKLVNKQHEQDVANTTSFRQTFTVRMESLLAVLGPETSQAVSVGNALAATGSGRSSTSTQTAT